MFLVFLLYKNQTLGGEGGGWIGSLPRAIVVRDRSPRARALSESAAARDVAVIETYSYPQLAAPCGPAEEARSR